MKKFYEHTAKLTKKIQRELGAGFKENVLQAALAVEFIHAKIAYEKELALDVLYKKHPVGYIIADFYIPKQTNFGISEDIIIETKHTLSCRPCGLHGKKECPEKHFKCSEIELNL